MEQHHSVLEQNNAIKKWLKRVGEHENELNTCKCLKHSSSMRGTRVVTNSNHACSDWMHPPVMDL